MRRRTISVLALALLASAVHAQPSKPSVDPADWPRYARDPGGERYCPLKDINTANVAKLEPAWSVKVRPEGGGALVSSATPIVLDGVMYLPIGNAVIALDPVSGKEIWRHPVAKGLVRRAVSYWPGDKGQPARIFFSTGEQIIALDPTTGRIDTGFGKDGALDLGVPYNGPPTVYKNVLIVGANVNEMPVGPPGDTRAFDSKTGKELWTATLDYSAQSVPITYRGKDGRQYVALVAAGSSGPRAPGSRPANNESLIAFALPR